MKAKEVPIGTKYEIDGVVAEIIAYSRQGDEVVVVEDENGKAWTVNINDIQPRKKLTQEEKIVLLEAQLKEAIEAFEEHIRAVDSARRGYHDSTLWWYDGYDDRIDAAEQRLWSLKENIK